MRHEEDLSETAAIIVAEMVNCGIRTTRAIKWGVMTFKCLVETQDGRRIVVRFYPETRESVVACEPDLLRRCRLAGLPVPIVLTDSRTGPKAPLAYVAYQLIEGHMLSAKLPGLDAVQQRVLAREIVDCISLFQKIPFDGYGELVTSDTARDSSWRAFVTRSVDAGLAATTRNSLLDPAAILTLNILGDRIKSLSIDGDSALVWGDINFDNILVDDAGRLAGLIDFESCLAGDPVATLGYCIAAQGFEPMCFELLDAWSRPMAGDLRHRILSYVILRGLRLASYAHRPLPTGHPRDPLDQIFPGLMPAIAELSAPHSTG
jgi:aminoglycoside phosphotransferase (APT) family kinase protein